MQYHSQQCDPSGTTSCRVSFNDRKYKVTSYGGSLPRPISPKDAFKLTPNQVICEMWRRRISRSSVDLVDRLRLQAAYDEDRKRMNLQRMNECLDTKQISQQESSSRPSTAGNQKTTSLKSSHSPSRPCTASDTLRNDKNSQVGLPIMSHRSK